MSNVEKIIETVERQMQESSTIIDGMILTLANNPRIRASDIERLIESAENILKADYS